MQLSRHISSILTISFLFFLFSFSNKHKVIHDEIGSIQVSKNDSSILFSYFINDTARLYTLDIATSRVQELLRVSDNNLLNPMYSNDNKKIVFIAHSHNNTLKSSLCVYDLIQNTTSVLMDGVEIKEAIFSADDKVLYYTVAQAYEKYSPIGRRAHHGYDIYSYNIIEKKSKKITDYNSYIINNLSLINDSTIAYYSVYNYDLAGIFFIDINSSQSKFQPFSQTGIDSSLNHAVLYSKPTNSLLLLSSSYMMYVIDKNSIPKDTIVPILHLSDQIRNYTTFNNSGVFACVILDKPQIHIYDTAGTHIKSYDINKLIPKK